ncbi:uncharacterized membrane protein (UPF0136 family) [Paenibacillus lupini]|nr:uncharacterized membrane protein (UPF0136 family) [Paenibacillus lupini]
MKVFKGLINALFYSLVFLVYWIQIFTWLSILIVDLFHAHFKSFGVMVIIGAVAALLFCFLIRFIRKRYPIIFKLLFLLHLALFLYTLHTFSHFDEPIKTPINAEVQE